MTCMKEINLLNSHYVQYYGVLISKVLLFSESVNIFASRSLFLAYHWKKVFHTKYKTAAAMTIITPSEIPSKMLTATCISILIWCDIGLYVIFN